MTPLLEFRLEYSHIHWVAKKLQSDQRYFKAMEIFLWHKLFDKDKWVFTQSGTLTRHFKWGEAAEMKTTYSLKTTDLFLLILSQSCQSNSLWSAAALLLKKEAAIERNIFVYTSDTQQPSEQKLTPVPFRLWAATIMEHAAPGWEKGKKELNRLLVGTFILTILLW